MKQQRHLAIILALFLVYVEASKTDGRSEEQNAHLKQAFPFGDYRNCFVDDFFALRLETLPGIGWDNLRNRVSGEVAFFNYSQCRTTEDGRYLIPNDVFVTPLKESVASLFSELIDHWSNYSSMTSTTINSEAHVLTDYGIISGKFSFEYKYVKKHQVEDSSITSRVMLRYRVYAAHLQPHAQLHPKFKARLLDIGAHLLNKNMPVARFLADMLIRDYGTHYITRVDAGGILAKLDHILKSYVKSSTLRETKESASASFFGLFGGGESILHKHKVSTSYTKNVMDSKAFTYGGPPVRNNLTIEYWEDNLLNNLVSIDREGDPLHFIITPDVLPELPEETTFQLSSIVLKSLQLYYKNNAITGCTDAESPNFNFQANLDDHSCKALQTNFTFGGVFQTCKSTGSPPNDPCVGYRQKNPKTQAYSCPKQYLKIHLHKGTLATQCKRSCHGWWMFKSCHTNCGGGSYDTYWCAADGRVHQDSGYMFGGVYSDSVNNVITKAKKCPNKFYPQRFGPKDVYVCISDDYELGAQYRIPFGGFISCMTGNPLAGTQQKGLTPSDTTKEKISMPKRCPLGFTQHLVVIDEDCEINYCTKANFLTAKGLPTIKRPPFHSKPKFNTNIMFPMIIENNDTNKVYIRLEEKSERWIELTPKMAINMPLRNEIPEKSAVEVLMREVEEMKKQENQHTGNSSKKSHGLSAGATVGITIGATLFAGILIILIFKLRRRQSPSINANRSRSGYNTFEDS